MEYEILKLVYDYSVAGKLIDNNFIDKLINLVVDKKEISNYVRNVYFTNNLDKSDQGVCCAAYSPLHRAIFIDYESINIILDYLTRYDDLFSPFERIMFRNLKITQFILHELEHAFQNKKLIEAKDDLIETRLIKASLTIESAMQNSKVMQALKSGEISARDFVTYHEYSKKIYREYYTLSPIERLAQVKSYKTILAAIESIKKYIPNLYEFKQASLIEQMLNGYPESWQQGVCPTQVYLFADGKKHVWADLDFYDEDGAKLWQNVKDKYSYPMRLTLGLPVSYDEYQNTNSWLYTTNKFNS